MRVEDQVLGDIRTTADADAVWQTMHSLVRMVKATGARIHLLPTGGRRAPLRQARVGSRPRRRFMSQ